MESWKLNFISCACFEVVAVMYFIQDGKTGLATTFMILGFSQLFLGIAGIQKAKEEKKNENECSE